LKNYYQILGLPFGASQAEIKSAYRKLAFQFHPDKNDGNKYAQEKFIEITEAYDVLSSKDKSYFYYIEYTDYLNNKDQPKVEIFQDYKYNPTGFPQQARGPATKRDVDLKGIFGAIAIIFSVFVFFILLSLISPGQKEEINRNFYNNTYDNPYDAVSNNRRPITKDEYYLLLFQDFSETHDSTLLKIDNVDSMIRVIDSINGF
jgi:curved DNA-binding protein CbpA